MCRDGEGAAEGEMSAPRRDARVINCDGPLGEEGRGEGVVVGGGLGWGGEGGGEKAASDADEVRVQERCNGWIACEAASVPRA